MAADARHGEREGSSFLALNDWCFSPLSRKDGPQSVPLHEFGQIAYRAVDLYLEVLPLKFGKMPNDAYSRVPATNS